MKCVLKKNFRDIKKMLLNFILIFNEKNIIITELKMFTNIINQNPSNRIGHFTQNKVELS